MASFETLKSGNIRASVCVNGRRDKKSFGTLKKAKSWARDRESELSKLEAVIDDTRTFGDMFDRYSKEVFPKKRRGSLGNSSPQSPQARLSKTLLEEAG